MSGVRSKTEERLDMLRREKKVAEVAECTFKPIINRKSANMMNGRCETLRTLNLSAHEQLFQDAVRRQMK